MIRLECSFGADGEGKTEERESASDEFVVGRFAAMGESAWALGSKCSLVIRASSSLSSTLAGDIASTS